MREINFYEFQREMPATDDGQISIPKFMLTQHHEEVKPSRLIPTLFGIVQIISFLAFIYFFMAIDWMPVLSWVGMPISFAVFIAVSVWRGRDDNDRSC